MPKKTLSSRERAMRHAKNAARSAKNTVKAVWNVQPGNVKRSGKAAVKSARKAFRSARGMREEFELFFNEGVDALIESRAEQGSGSADFETFFEGVEDGDED
jgi:hypothetical protein